MEADLLQLARMGRIGRTSLFEKSNGFSSMVLEITGAVDPAYDVLKGGAGFLPGLYRIQPGPYGMRIERLNPRGTGSPEENTAAFFAAVENGLSTGIPPYNAYETLYSMRVDNPPENQHPFLELMQRRPKYEFSGEADRRKFTALYTPAGPAREEVAGRATEGDIQVGGTKYHWGVHGDMLTICVGNSCLSPGSPGYNAAREEVVCQGLWSPAGAGPVGENGDRTQLPASLKGPVVRPVPDLDTSNTFDQFFGLPWKKKTPDASTVGPAVTKAEPTPAETAEPVPAVPQEPVWREATRRTLVNGRWTEQQYRISDAGIEIKGEGGWTAAAQAYYLDPVTGDLSRGGKIIGRMGVSTSDKRNAQPGTFLEGDASLVTNEGRVWHYLPGEMQFSGPGAQRGVTYAIVHGRDPKLDPLSYSAPQSRKAIVETTGGLRGDAVAAFIPQRDPAAAAPVLRMTGGAIEGFAAKDGFLVSADGATRVNPQTGTVERFVHRLSNYYTLDRQGTKTMERGAMWVKDPYTTLARETAQPPAPVRAETPVLPEPRRLAVDPVVKPVRSAEVVADPAVRPAADTVAAPTPASRPASEWPPKNTPRPLIGGWVRDGKVYDENNKLVGYTIKPEATGGAALLADASGRRVYTADGTTLLGSWGDFNFNARADRQVLFNGQPITVSLVPKKSGGFVNTQTGRSYEQFSQLVEGRVVPGFRPAGSRERYAGGAMPRTPGGALHLDSSSAHSAVAGNSGITIVKVAAPFYCPPCNTLAPTFESFAGTTRNGGSVAAISVTGGGSWGVGSYPTTVVYRNGQEVHRQTGVVTEDTLRAWSQGRW